MKVPVYEGPQVQTRPLPDAQTRVDISPENYGAGLGRAIEHGRDVYLAVAAKASLEADQIAVQSAENQLSEWQNSRLFNPQSGAFAMKSKDAFGLATRVLPEYDEQVTKINASLATPRQQRAFAQIQQARRLAMDEQLNKHEMSERENYYDQETEATIKDSVSSAGNFYNDPKQIKYQLNRQEQTIIRQASRKGWPDEKRDDYIRSMRSKTHLEVLDRMIALKQSTMARGYLEQVRKQMQGDDVTTVERALQTEDAVAKGQLRDQLQDIEAAAKSGITITSIPPKDTLVAAFGEYEGGQLYNNARAYADMSTTIAGLHGQSAKELVETMGNYEPKTQKGAADQSQRASIVDAQIREILHRREEDPATYLISQNPQIRTAWQNMFQGDDPAAVKEYMQTSAAERERLQIYNQDPLPKYYADQVVSNITKPKDNETLYVSANNERERWGAYWPQIYSQIAPKLPDVVAVITSGIAPQPAIALSAMANLKQNELEGLVPNGSKWGDVVNEVDRNFKDYLRSFPVGEGTKTANAIHDSAIRLALHHTQTGSKLSSAVELAYKELASDQDDLVEFRGVPYRVPRGLDPGLVETGATSIVEKFELPPGSSLVGAGSGLTDEELTTLSSEFIQDNGYWMTNPDGTGLQLFLDGAPVTGPEGIVEYSWLELAAGGQEIRDKSKTKPPRSSRGRDF